MILDALGRGWGVLRCHKKAIFFAYLLNLGVAALLLLPFMQIFDQSLGPGLYREQMVGQIDYDWWVGYRQEVTGFAASFSPWVSGAGPLIHGLEGLLSGTILRLPWTLLGLGGLYLLLNSFLVAAAVGSFALDPGGTSSREFFRTGATYLGRFLRLALLAFAVCLGLYYCVKPLLELIQPLVKEASSDRIAFMWGFGLYMVWLGVLLFLDLLFDYAKIKTAAEDRTSVILAFFSALTFCRRHLFSVVALYLILGSVALVGIGLYAMVDSLVIQDSGWTILLALFCQQLFMVGRMLLKLLFYSGQMQFFLAAGN